MVIMPIHRLKNNIKELHVFEEMQEPEESDLRKIEGEHISIQDWNIIVCRYCRNSFDILKAHDDGQGNILCPYCKNSN